MYGKMLENDGVSDDLSDWGSDFDDDVEEETVHQNGDIYEIPDGKPAAKPVPTVVPGWLKKVSEADENVKPPDVYIENVLLPTRATKDEESKNFIETLKRKLSQKNLLVGGAKYSDPKPPHQIHNNQNNVNSIISNTAAEHNATEYGLQIKKIKESLQKFPWFYRVDRSKAELILENYTTDGCFLVRECFHGAVNVPFTLTIRFHGRLFHIQIRLRADSRFALGTLKVNEMHFGTVAEMIDTYKKTYLQLHSNGKFFGETKLTHPPIVYSFSNKC